MWQYVYLVSTIGINDIMFSFLVRRPPLTLLLKPALTKSPITRPSNTYVKRMLSDLYPKLIKQQVTWFLRQNEFSSGELNEGVIKSFMSNSLPACSPTEDRAAEVKLNLPSDEPTHRYIFGVFDGHAGGECAQLISERIFSYIAVMLSPYSILEKIQKEELNPCHDLTFRFNHKGSYYNSHMDKRYKAALQKLANDLLESPNHDCSKEDLLKGAFMRLDHDLLAECIPKEGQDDLIDLECLSLAFTGSCANIAYIHGRNVYVANTGDCRAIIGQQNHKGEWLPVALSKDHDVNNANEVQRIYNQHPGEESTVIRNGRLLGDLAPLRAFGNARYKWPARVMKHILNICFNPNAISVYGDHLIPKNYHRPPYLTAEPEVIHHALTPNDKFLVLASDGLSEYLDPQKVIDYVAEHMEERQIMTNFSLPREDITIKEINKLLKDRKKSLVQKKEDENVATHLLRMALGPDHTSLSQHLSLSEDEVKHYRDDITITVVYFNTDYIHVMQRN
ncbi:pyruvate dehydrogenase [acetyl-transferring]-phosphatase 1, mitochondrial-like [Mya arenaria]|uniref:pyruvate dehydrogenase [acetyl-transferring]-phosphatase 1, mitochondrial-like n=1 Tax=Mya arenaria TaxID=6604 RepID=UPI0022E10862|nr:pyruvate dehydrogenase [acetyl-transferring]-phosphatase 1, mitochondrial-like [Mya arenaria]